MSPASRATSLAVVAAIVLAGCGGSPETEAPPDTEAPPLGAVAGDDPVDREAAVERFVAVCETFGSATHDCQVEVEAVVDQSIDAGCAVASLEAYYEHVAAHRGVDEPHDEFFERCPRPLSVVMVVEPPDGFGAQGPAAFRTGVMRTEQVAGEFRDAEAVRAWLDSIGHEMGYQQAWARGDDAIIVRLDRFGSIDGARTFTDPAAQTEGPGIERRTILGVDDGRLTTEVVEGVDRPHQHLAVGRACEVVVTVHALGSTEAVDVELVRSLFLDQARRAQIAVDC